MKKSWILPACFLLAAALVNFVALLVGHAEVAALVKPALLPLVALTSVAAAGGMAAKSIRLLVAAQLLGCAGDILLISGQFIPFACGLGCFFAGHVFYCILFGGISWKGLSAGRWVLAAAGMAAAVAGVLAGVGVKGTFLIPFAAYGFMLMLLIFSGFAGVLRGIKDSSTWWIITLGGVLFTFSDSLITLQIFRGRSDFREFLIMLTYVAAQCLLATGALKLSGSYSSFRARETGMLRPSR